MDSIKARWVVSVAGMLAMLVVARSGTLVFGDDEAKLTWISLGTLGALIYAPISLWVVAKPADVRGRDPAFRWLLGTALCIAPFMVSFGLVAAGEPTWTMWAVWAVASVLLIVWTAKQSRST